MPIKLTYQTNLARNFSIKGNLTDVHTLIIPDIIAISRS